jgi:hypothetical protein
VPSKIPATKMALSLFFVVIIRVFDMLFDCLIF